MRYHPQGAISVIDNDIDNSRNLSVSATFLGIELYEPNINFFLEGRVNYRFPKESGHISAHYRMAYGDRMGETLEPKGTMEAIPADGTQALRGIGFTGCWNFVKREDYKIARTGIFSSRPGTKAPFKSYRLYGMRAGYELFRTVIASESTYNFEGKVTESFPRDTMVVAQAATPMFRMNMISVGIQRRLVDHAEFKVNNAGSTSVYRHMVTTTVYCDFLIGTKMMFDDVLVPLMNNAPNSAYSQSGSGGGFSAYNYYRVNINEGTNKVPIGARFGWEQITTKPVGWLIGYEMGFRPGVFGPAFNAYLQVKLGLTFNMRAK